MSERGEAAPGTSEPLTEASAATAILSLLSTEVEDEQTSEAPAPETAEVDETEETPAPEESDTTEQSDDEEEPNETEESTEAEAPQPRTYRVKVDGDEVEVTEDELLKGYSRTADYTRKTQAVADKDRALEAERTAVTEERQRYAQYLSQLEALVDTNAQPEPDWEALRADPTVFAATHAEWELQQRQRAALKAERERAEAQVQADAQTALQRHMVEEQEKLNAALPEWKDETVRKTEQKEITDYALSLGYTQKDLSQLADHRVILMLRDAARGRKQAARKATVDPIVRQKIEKAKDAAPGSSPRAKQPVTEVTRAKQALAKTGSVDDAAAAIKAMLQNGALD
jgi:hypothetical protein